MYAILDENKVLIWDRSRETLQTIAEHIPQYANREIQEIPEGYVIYNNEVLEIEEANQRKQEELQGIINNLTMTALDFIGVLREFGLTLEEINTYLENNLEVKMQLTYCQNVYCGVVKQLMPLMVGEIEITEEMVEQAFKAKNGLE